MSKLKHPASAMESLPSSSVVPIDSAVAVFIGYTEKALVDGKTAFNTPIGISSIDEFHQFFGGAPQTQFDFIASDPSLAAAKTTGINPFTVNSRNNIAFQLVPTTVNYRLYMAMLSFFANSGSSCYIISVGAYDYTHPTLSDNAPFLNALKALEDQPEPTLLVIPDAVELKNNQASDLTSKYAGCYALQAAMLNHCGTLENRLAILDVPEGFGGQDSVSLNATTSSFRKGIQDDFLSYGAAYFPWLQTDGIAVQDISSNTIAPAGFTIIRELLTADFKPVKKQEIADRINAFVPENQGKPALEEAHAYFLQNSPSYKVCMELIQTALCLIPPSAAIAGICRYIDQTRGVWTAPANISIKGVIAPGYDLTDADQGNFLNVPTDGKSICGIRSFPGQGTRVWGARTLDGNSNDWRYIQSRRLIIYIEQSIKNALQQFIFSPNDSHTWASAHSTITAFLLELWKQGGLLGEKSSDAFTVTAGMGSTMTADDIQNGIMRIVVTLQCTRPAEFIELPFEVKVGS